MNKIVTLSWFLVIVMTIGCGTSQSANKVTADRSGEIQALVNGLRSQNAEPEITQSKTGHQNLKLPRGYSDVEQRRVYGCYKVVLDREVDAFAALVSQLDDNNYCLTVRLDESTYSNCSVGDMCRQALRLQLDDPYLKHVIARSPNDRYKRFSYVYNVVGKGEKAKLWANGHAGQSLASIQCEAITWFLSEAKHFREDASASKHTGDIRELEFGNSAPSADELTAVRKLLNTLTKTDKAVRLDDLTAAPTDPQLH